MMSFPIRLLVIATILSAAGLPTGCKPADRSAPGAAENGPPKPPPVPVDVVLAIQENIIEYRIFTGRTVSAHAVEIRPRVSGYLEQAPGGRSTSGTEQEIADDSSLTASRTPSDPDAKDHSEFFVSVKEGDRVEAGAPLFQIDPRPYQFALEQARGSKVALEAQRDRIQNELVRLEKLKLTNSISDTDLELALANFNESAGQLTTLAAAVRRAELDLEFTQIRAPISGLLGRTLVTRKNIVAADTTILTTIVSTDPLHVFFDIDEASFLTYRQLELSGQLPNTVRDGVPVALGLANDQGFPYQGKIDYTNNTTNPGSGNTLLRAEFDNTSDALAPGLFCRVRVPFSPVHEATLIPTKCLAMDQQGRFVMAVNAQNVVERRNVKVGSNQGPYTVILEGVQPGESVIYAGLQKVRPGATVNPTLSKSIPPFEMKAGEQVSTDPETVQGETK